MKKFYYLLSLIFVFIIPSLIAFYFVSSRVSWFNLIVFAIVLTAMGSLWDIWATRHGKRDPVWLWTFNHRDTLGIRIHDLPIEEYLFYVFAGIYVVFMWELIKWSQATGDIFIYFLMSFIGVWTVLAIFVPYKIRAKKDKV